MEEKNNPIPSWIAIHVGSMIIEDEHETYRSTLYTGNNTNETINSAIKYPTEERAAKSYKGLRPFITFKIWD